MIIEKIFSGQCLCFPEVSPLAWLGVGPVSWFSFLVILRGPFWKNPGNPSANIFWFHELELALTWCWEGRKGCSLPQGRPAYGQSTNKYFPHGGTKTNDRTFIFNSQWKISPHRNLGWDACPYTIELVLPNFSKYEDGSPSEIWFLDHQWIIF